MSEFENLLSKINDFLKTPSQIASITPGLNPAILALEQKYLGVFLVILIGTFGYILVKIWNFANKCLLDHCGACDLDGRATDGGGLKPAEGFRKFLKTFIPLF